jgi:DNA modification methylase
LKRKGPSSSPSDNDGATANTSRAKKVDASSAVAERPATDTPDEIQVAKGHRPYGSAAANNTLYFGDNLDVLARHIASDSVDLIYLDPPFNSNQDYNILFAEQDGTRSAAQIKVFEDTWSWDVASAAAYRSEVAKGGPISEVLQAFFMQLGGSNMLAYLAMMAPRLEELHRVLKNTGSIYLHCDPTASHYLKVLMDAVFGARNFRSEIVWRRTNAHNKTTSQYGPIHDVILFYSKTETFKFHPGTRPYTKAYIEDRFVYSDARGRYQLNYLTGPGTRKGESGQRWRDFDPTSAGRHWAIPRSLRQFLTTDGVGMTSHAQLEALYTAGFIVFPKKPGGQPMYKQYIGPGVFYQDIWAFQPNTRGVLWGTDECIDQDVKYLEDEEESLDYPTQKPLGLLKRIIETSSDPDDVVLDPFCGCGTCVDASQELGREWTGIDITHLSVNLIKNRLKTKYRLEMGRDYVVHGEPTDLAGATALASNDRHEFQNWALGLVGARRAEVKKGADQGVDGKLIFHDDYSNKSKSVIFSVKSGHVQVRDVRELAQVVSKNRAQIGVLITLEHSTKPMRAEAASEGFYESPTGARYPKVQILSIDELLAGGRVAMPSTALSTNTTFRAAKRAVAAPTALMLDLSGNQIEPSNDDDSVDEDL